MNKIFVKYFVTSYNFKSTDVNMKKLELKKDK